MYTARSGSGPLDTAPSIFPGIAAAMADQPGLVPLLQPEETESMMNDEHDRQGDIDAEAQRAAPHHQKQRKRWEHRNAARQSFTSAAFASGGHAMPIIFTNDSD
ncbi:MAG TPA: hypothetical protein PLL33_07000 [Paracoccus sp. (in: a-proteobacteria)]|nr:hypothetical protein [Paracoccus sp. (in: a-proteobacteria)]